MNPKPDYRRILVTLLSPIGDTLFATPAIHRLRSSFPKAYIAALAFPTNQGVLHGNPDLDEVFTYPTLEWWPGYQYFAGLLKKLRDTQFDLAVDLCTAFWISRLIIAPRRRLRLRFGGWWWLIPRRLRGKPQSHAISHYLRVLDPLGLTETQVRPLFSVGSEDREFARLFLHAWGIEDGSPLIAIHPGGEGFGGKKCWRADGFAQVGLALAEEFGARILLLGGDSDQERSGYVCERIGRHAINGTGTTTLTQTAALVERCQLFIGNDSSPLHISASMGTPVVGIYGPSNPANFYPFGVRNVVIRAERHCAPCFHFVGTVPLWKRSACRTCKALDGITAEQVLAGARRMLTESCRAASMT